MNYVFWIVIFILIILVGICIYYINNKSGGIGANIYNAIYYCPIDNTRLIFKHIISTNLLIYIKNQMNYDIRGGIPIKMQNIENITENIMNVNIIQQDTYSIRHVKSLQGIKAFKAYDIFDYEE